MPEQVSARAQQAEPKSKLDGKQRIYLYVEGEDVPCLEYLQKYPDDDPDSERVTVRKVSEIRLDRLNDDHVIIPVVRDIHRDRRVQALIPSAYENQPPQLKYVEERGPVKECKPVFVADFYTRARGRDAQDEFREKDFIRAVGAVCMPAGPRVKRVGNNQDGHVNYLCLRWG